MLLIEKVIKLLDDTHYALFYEHVRTLSKRSYYPLVLLDVVERETLEGLPSERMFFEVYGEEAAGQKDLQKLFSLGHYTFRLTGFLSRNYPNYLGWNISRIQQRINEGELDRGRQIAEMLLEVATRIGDLSNERAVLGILAQDLVHRQAFTEARQYYDRIGTTLERQRQLNELNVLCYTQGFDSSVKLSSEELDERLAQLNPYVDSGSIGVQLLARLERVHLLHVGRDARFFSASTLTELDGIREELQRNEYVVLPFLQNLRSKLDFLRLRYSMRQDSEETVLRAAENLSEDAAQELFWNSYVNLPELSSIAVQTSYLVSNYFYSYRHDAEDFIPAETSTKITELTRRCEQILANPLLEENYVIPFINLTTIYGGLLLLGDEASRKKCIHVLEVMLMNYQQIAFHAYLDPVFATLVMAHFSLNEAEGVEKNYRRFKKSSKGKNVNYENTMSLEAYYFITKYRETGRAGYVKKLSRLLEEASARPSLAKTIQGFTKVCQYFEIPIEPFE
ncbi:hypothetical protein CEQ90_13855 [Lewinellaceae bacterium SD302]|nr:hypothetical protein CEQ90_13855 [Lewinellaceae bacterium SD302]